MAIKESNIVHDNGKAWVHRDKTPPASYDVYIIGVTHSTHDSSYPMTEDGLSIAKIRADYFAKPKS